MSNSTFSTGHSQFFMAAAVLGLAASDLEIDLRKVAMGIELDTPWPEGKELFEAVIKTMGLAAEYDNEGNCIDISTTTGRFPLEYETALLQAFAPHVRAGSHLVFFGTDENMCWALSWNENKSGVMEGRSVNVIPVETADLHDLMAVLKTLNIRLLHNKFEQKYGEKLKNHPKEE